MEHPGCSPMDPTLLEFNKKRGKALSSLSWQLALGLAARNRRSQPLKAVSVMFRLGPSVCKYGQNCTTVADRVISMLGDGCHPCPDNVPERDGSTKLREHLFFVRKHRQVVWQVGNLRRAMAVRFVSSFGGSGSWCRPHSLLGRHCQRWWRRRWPY